MKKRPSALLAFALAGALAFAPAAPAADPPTRTADLVLRNGTIWRGKGLTRAQSLASIGEEIAAIGTDAEVSRWIGPKTRVVDLAGRLVVPGFDDAHAHFLAGGQGLLSVNLRPAKDVGDVARRLADYVKTLAPGEWVLGGRWDHEAWPSRALPTRQDVDAVTRDHPVLVWRIDGHMALANSKALALAGVGRETKDPDGGTIVRDAAGEPTGVLKDNAVALVSRVVTPASRERKLDAIRAAMAEAARLGVTSVNDNSEADALRLYVELAAKGALTVRIYAWRYATELGDLLRGGLATGLGDDHVRLGAIKILSDGALGSGTAAMFAPYADDPRTSGLLLWPIADLERMVRDADAGGFQLAVHAIGDRANSLVLDAFAKAKAVNRPRDRRFRVEHAQHVRLADLDRFKELGVVASIQPTHAIDDMRWAEKRIGRERLADAYNLKSFLAKGIPVAFGTDWAVEPLDPRLGLFAAVTRKSADDPSLPAFKPQEAITLEEAIDLYTRGSAFASFQENRKGTLETGKLCDAVVFGKDLFALEKTDPRALLTAPVDLTIVGGRVVHSR